MACHSHLRRTLLSLTAAGLASAAAPAVAATEAFCGVVPYVPSWAFTLPWTEAVVPTGAGDPVWLRKVGQEPTSGFLGLGKKGAAEYVFHEQHRSLSARHASFYTASCRCWWFTVAPA